MKYKITIEGGFMGISKEYNGEIDLTKSDSESILKDMTDVMGNNPNVRDGFLYNIALEKDDKIFHHTFGEGNLPISLRNFIDRIRQKD